MDPLLSSLMQQASFKREMPYLELKRAIKCCQRIKRNNVIKRSRSLLKKGPSMCTIVVKLLRDYATTVVISRHLLPFTSPPTTFHFTHQPLMIVEYVLCWLRHLSSHNHPPHLHYQYTPPNILWCALLTHNIFCPLLGSQLLVLWRKWHQTKCMHHHPWCSGDDDYALGLGILKPYAMAWIKAARGHD